tara:strand:- start:3070 stop:3756 length:687 start_codon:yes stop_codon:yes gene_type:complete
MKIFLDTADVETISNHFKTGLIDGVTTNPTLIMKSHRKPDDVYQELASLGLRDISMEVVGTEKEMLKDANRLVNKFNDVATIKVPCTREGLVVCRELSKQGVRVNVTLIFSVSQAILSAKAGATYLSPFVGRVDDQRFGGCNLIKRISEVIPKTTPINGGYSETPYRVPEILSASIRSVGDVEHSFAQGADICTLPPKIFEGMYNHILTDKGLELFDIDYQKTIKEFS